jgi:hypothetical protein
VRCALLAALTCLLTACASQPLAPPAPVAGTTPQSCPPVAASPANLGAGIYVRLFDGVLTLPPGYVLDGNQIGSKVLFQGRTGAVRIGLRTELNTGYMDYVRATLKARELRCGLEVLRHGTDAPPLWLLLGKTHYALAYDQDPGRMPALIDAYCATVQAR